MAVNKPTGDNARKGAVRKRSQLKTKVEGEATGRNEAKRPGGSWFRKRARRQSLSREYGKRAR